MPRFTAANARENAAKAHAARRQRLASGKLAGETLPQTPQLAPLEPADERGDAYALRRLSRVRTQLDLIDQRINDIASKPSPDGQTLSWLCAAQERLSEQERVLAGRPLPGSIRPRAPREGRQRAGAVRPLWGIAPVVASPPVVQATPASAASPPPAPNLEAPIPLLAATPSPHPVPTVGPVPAQQQPVPIEVALRHRPAPQPTLASPAPPSQKPG